MIFLQLSKEFLGIVDRMQDINPINPKTAWWLIHKNDPNILTCMRAARKKYYYKNQEIQQQKGREYYYKRKALLNPPVELPQTIPKTA